MNNARKQFITYDPATGRIADEANRDLLTKVTNAHADGTEISSYTYTNDLLGRRTSKNDEQYGYNIRDELIAADDVSYNYDDIGNRTIAEGKAYTANNLNQYTAIDDFAPQYDDDGNQTLIKTETGTFGQSPTMPRIAPFIGVPATRKSQWPSTAWGAAWKCAR